MEAIRAIGRRAVILLGVCALAAAAHPARSAAQQPLAPPRFSVRGVLQDAISHLPVPRGSITLSESGQLALADGEGRFEMRDVASGPRLLRIEALGYLPVVVPVVVSDTTAPLVVQLQPEPIPIAGLNVGPAGTPTVWGVVVDDRSGAGIPFGSVWLRNRNRTAVADERGSFRLARVPEGNDLLLVSKLGYASVYMPVRAEPSADPVEVRLRPDSIVLAGVRVVAQQLKSRRNASLALIREYPQERIVRSGSKDAWAFLTTWSSLNLIACEGGRVSITCVPGRRGVPTPAVVYVDEMRIPEGLDMLKTYPVHEIYSIELSSRGEIHLYTNGFIEKLARRPQLLIDDASLPAGTRPFGG